MRTAIICINGIFTDPRSDTAWTDRAVDWLNLNCDNVVAESYEYDAHLLAPIIGQKYRVKAVKMKVEAFRKRGDRVILIAHSNGCDIAAKVARETFVDELHLISPATDEHVLDEALFVNNVEGVHIYGSTNDSALKWARIGRFLTLGMGSFGSLGLRAAAYEREWAGVVFDHSDNSFDHGTWLEPNHLPTTLTEIAYYAQIDLK